MTTRRSAWVAALANLVLAPRDRWRAPTAPRPAPAPPPTRAQAVACLFFSIRATGPLSFFAILAVAGGRVVALVADAAVVARRANPYAPKAYNRWWVYLAVPVVLVLVMEPVGPGCAGTSLRGSRCRRAP